jgi:allantoate deiminase
MSAPVVTPAAETIRRCRLLAGCSEETGATTRTFLSAPMREVHAHVGGWMRGAGMAVSVDAAGNIRGVYPGAEAGGRRLFIASHLDTVPNAGAFDGVLGVMMGVALVESLGGRRLPFAIEVVGFSEEEGARFATPFIGSLALAGRLDETLLARRDADGVSVADAIRSFGLDPAGVADARAGAGALGYLEFHIEQGPVLDASDLPVAVVSAIVGMTRCAVTFTGAANHAGTTPMEARRDAVAGAAEWIAEVERLAQISPDLLATVGRVDAEPGAVNVIAGRCAVSLDVRHPVDETRIAAVRILRDRAEQIAGRRGLDVLWQVRLEQGAVPMDAALSARLEQAVADTGTAVRRMPSGAGHDAMILAALMPVAMLFLRTPGGISHHPDEAVREDDVALALRVGQQFLARLAEAAA